MKEILKKIPLFRSIRSLMPERFSENYSDYHRFRGLIAEGESYSDQELRDFQFLKLKELLDLAWSNLRGYRDHWEKSGFEPSQFKSPEDIQLIPTISKHEFRQNPDLFINPEIRKKFLHKSGGSTGTPFQFYEPLNARIIEKAFMHEIWSRFYPQISLKTRSTIIRGKIIRDAVQFDPMLGLILTTFRMTEENAKDYCKAIDRYRTPLLHAYPAAVYFFARMIERNQWELDHQFQAIMLGSEKLYDFQRETLKRVFNAPVCHWYGQAEQVVLAGNLRDDELFHSEALYGFTELVTEAGHPAKPGDSGEIIGTGFWNTVTPMIRYKTLDRAESGSDFSSIPGKGIFTTIHGRMQDVVVSGTGSLMSLVGLAPVMAQFNEIENFRFIQEEKGKLELLYIPTGNNSPGPDQVRAGILKALGDEYEVIPVEVSEIPPSPAGKNTFLQQNMDLTPYY